MGTVLLGLAVILVETAGPPSQRDLQITLILLLFAAVLRFRAIFPTARPVALLGVLLLLAAASVALAGGGTHPISRTFSLAVLPTATGVALLGFALGRRQTAMTDAGVRRVLYSGFDSIHEPVVHVADGCRVIGLNWLAELTYGIGLRGSLVCESSFFERDSCDGCPIADVFDGRGPRTFCSGGDANAARQTVLALPVLGTGDVVIEQVLRVVDASARARREQARGRDDVVMDEGLHRSARLSSLGAFVSGLAHELNHPIAEILCAADAVLRGGPRAADAVVEIAAQAERARKIVHGVLRLAGRAASVREEVDLRSVVDDVADLIGRPLALDGVTLRVDASSPGARVSADRVQLEQVLVNLIANARDAIRSSRGHGTVRVSIGGNEERTWIRVRDDGPGVAEADLPRLGEAFFTTKAAGRGTGLGLPFCRDVVLQHGGTLAIENGRGGEGVVVTVTLPRSPGASESRDDERPVATPRRVLVIDDEVLIAEFARAALESHGADVEVATDIPAARLTIDCETQFDVVFCDLCVHDARGDAFYEEVCAERPAYRGRFVFMTADVSVDLGRLTRDGNRVLTKPFDVLDIRRAADRTSVESCVRA